MSFLAKFIGKKEPTVRSLESQSSKHFDHVVIGAGLAGCVVANRLAERNPNVTVALIEAGDRATELEAPCPSHAASCNTPKEIGPTSASPVKIPGEDL